MARNPSHRIYERRWKQHAAELQRLAREEAGPRPERVPSAPVPLRQPRTAKAIKAKAERERILAAQRERVRQFLEADKGRTR